ncbi:MAG: DsbA family protein [Pseudomonadota bacterium]
MTKLTRRFVLGAATAMVAMPVFAQEAIEIEDIVIGNPDADVTVIEYASFTCPHCRTFHEGPFKELKAEYIDTGKIKFIYREVYFDPEGLWASMLARCAGPDRYMAIADMIYTQQREWPNRADPAATANNLKTMGKVAGLSTEEVDACFADRDMAKALVANYQKNAEADGINSTPSFLINGTKYNNISFEEMSEAIDAALGS